MLKEMNLMIKKINEVDDDKLREELLDLYREVKIYIENLEKTIRFNTSKKD